MNKHILIIFALFCTSCSTAFLSTYRDFGEYPYYENLTIQTEPSGCRLYIDDEYVGVSPFTGKVLIGKFPIQKNGHYLQKNILGGIWTRREPIVWYKDGYSFGKSNGSDYEFKCNIKAVKPGYKLAEKVFTIELTQKLFNSISLNENNKVTNEFIGDRKLLLFLTEIAKKNIKSFGGGQQQQQQQTIVIPQNQEKLLEAKVQIISEPKFCDIFVDDTFMGNTPAKLKLKNGTYTIELRKKGFKTYQKTIKVTNDFEITLHGELEQEE